MAIGRLCDKCDGKCPICDSYVRPYTLVRICDECNYGTNQGRCVICSGPGVSDAYYCKECCQCEKDMAPKKKQVVEEDDDELALLDEFNADRGAVIVTPAEETSKSKKKKGKGPKKVEEDDPELDELLKDLNALNTKAKEEDTVEVQGTLSDPKPDDDDDDDDDDDEKDGDDEAPEGGQLSAKALKNKLKKEKKKQAKLAKKHVEEQPEKAQPAGKKPTSLAAKLAAERQRQLQELEEKARQEEEERKRLEEEQRKKEEEEERIRLAKLEAKRQQRKEKRERQKREGKPMTLKEKMAAEMKRKFLEQLEKDGALDVKQDGETKRPSTASYRKKKTVKSDATQEQESKEQQEQGSASETECEFRAETIIITRSASPSSTDSEDVIENWEELDKPDYEKQEVKEKPVAPKPTPKPVKTRLPQPEEPEDESEYRSPICCVLGHVDTGKTKLLDKIRHSNVQNAEAGGITQQIGATFFPKKMLDKHCELINPEFKLKSSGLLIIDTPGHESFNNLRARGSSLCDIAILVVDIMHGLEPQTIESIGLLRGRKCYFVIALNKIDRLYKWNTTPWAPFHKTFENQADDTKAEFRERATKIMIELSEQGLNSELYWENDDIRRNISICPTSAITGEGISDLICLILQLTQKIMVKNITHKEEFRCSVLEVKAIEGLGTTVDVILISGTIKEGDKVVICGLSGPIVTTIRTLLTPQPLAELRVKGEYMKHTSIKAAMGVKIVAHGLEETVAGTEMLLVEDDDDIDALCEEVMQDISSIFDNVNRTGIGVYVMASTLGSLEALLQFLTDKKIPVFAVNIGTVQKKDVKKASIMREKDHSEYSVILAFDVKCSSEAEKEAQVLGVKIMSADIIYHLLDSFVKYLEETQEQKKQARISEAVFPCELTILPHCVFNKKDPFVFGVHVDNGILKPNTPLVAMAKGNQLMLGRVASMEHNKKPVEKAVKGQEICIKVVGEPNIAYGRHFDCNDRVYSRITRESIDVLKDYFRDEMTNVSLKGSD
ncbi:Eukaryotic translation initiation factor 5B [Babesia sp. Xinjiang]|uniref:Eukaryotic translation initiation factor 5B n=1 Tax=Babesia sp. Xinjiang TaxID=462227 RepID=UPI000A23F4D8|nr:Eukaryotic translation initiation factor 5B [Babesia sp. Xinjiang]XP_028871459.1 Eukaryotic translation initiation factor 5B [Babesia sp. Xinjiang]ORM40835.1 Eukaryotic translation initiation factor 5B [Babesia sp. Xinjiang]ORM41003.1 Eukaryotic translation initiation factor 5B [Babesia sp. Xinjiang]